MTGRLAIVGVGAVGGAAAGSLLTAGHRPALCVRRVFDRLEVQIGDELTGWTDLRVQRDPEPSDHQDILFVAVKAHQTAGAAPWLRGLVGPTTTVVVLQNGVEHETRVRPFIPDGASVLPAVVDLPVASPRPGRVEVRRPGSIVLPYGDRAMRVSQLFAPTAWLFEVRAASDFEQRLWTKLCVNVISGALPALTDQPGAVFRDEGVQRVAEAMIEECRAVAAAEGVDLDPDLSARIVRDFAAQDPRNVNSMLRDRRAGKLLEADARNGAVARLGRRHGIATPLNDMASTLLTAVNRPRGADRDGRVS